MITLNDLYEFVRINEYFPDRKRRERFTVIENATLGDPELQPLWVFLKDKFQKEIISDEDVRIRLQFQPMSREISCKMQLTSVLYPK